MRLSRPQRDLLKQLVFRWPEPCYLAPNRFGAYTVIVTTMMASRRLERLDRGVSLATVSELANAGLIHLVHVGDLPPYGYMRATDADHGLSVAVTPAGREAIAAVTEEQQRRARAIAAGEVGRGADDPG